jgi:ribosome-associated protein
LLTLLWDVDAEVVTVCATASAASGQGQNGEVSKPPILDVPLSGEPIRVGQFLKLAGLAEHGAHAKELLETGEVQVNGRVETRRGARLRTGDVVAVHGRRARAAG